MGLETTGNASRGIGGAPGAGATNVHMEPGAMSPAALIADIKLGLYVTEMIGSAVNPVTGDYSRGASGFIIANGEIAGAGRRDHHRRQSDRHVSRDDPRR